MYWRCAAVLPIRLNNASTEASAAFKNADVYIERYMQRPRHIEIQVLADEHGNCVFLGERECSIQRRHQKVIEESPSPINDALLRQKMGECAVRVAKSGTGAAKNACVFDWRCGSRTAINWPGYAEKPEPAGGTRGGP